MVTRFKTNRQLLTNKLAGVWAGLLRTPNWQSSAVVVVVFFIHAIVFWGSTIDDAFISFVYASNLAHGLGLVVNPGERVEGFSNPAWTLLAAVPEAAAIPAEIPMKVASLLCAAATVFLVSRRSFIAGLILALSTPFAFWSVNGLETSLFALLVVVAALCLNAEWPFAGAGAFAIGLAAVTRPEGAAYVIVGLLLRLILRRSIELRWVALALAPVVSWEIFRIGYYGSLLPNTYFAKAPLGAHGIPRGLTYVLVSALSEMLAVVVCLAISSGGRSSLISRRQWPVLGMLLMSLAFPVWSGGDWMVHGRFLVTAVPLALLFSGRVLGNPRSAALCVEVALLQAIFTALSDRELRGPFEQQLNAPAEILAELSSGSDRVAVFEAGVFPYRTHLYTIDLLGLNDPGLRSRGRQLKDAPAALFDLRPDWIQVNHVHDSLISRDPGYHRDFAPLSNYVSQPGAETWMVRKSLARRFLGAAPQGVVSPAQPGTEGSPVAHS